MEIVEVKETCPKKFNLNGWNISNKHICEQCEDYKEKAEVSNGN